MKFRKKPVEIIARYNNEKSINIVTLEGIMIANLGDWIITGIRGEEYPCKPDVFKETYEPVDEEAKNIWKEIYGE